MLEIFNWTARRQLLQLLLFTFFFHGSEYTLAVLIHGKVRVSASSLLISKQYVLAMACGLIEYVVELRIFPELKELWWLSNLGLALVLIGEFVRKGAIITAGPAFTHIIRRYHEEGHQLVTGGIYGIMRHPGYSGFFIWSIGTQMMLCNPICTIGFAVVLWRFFAARIQYEEYFLKQFFGQQHEQYAASVSSGLPFIK